MARKSQPVWQIYKEYVFESVVCVCLRFLFTDRWTSLVAVKPYGSSSFSLGGYYLKIPNPATSREPAPADNKHIRIGDVGFIRRGRFHLLFFAGCPLGERSRGVNVPYTFEELAVGKTVSGAPRPPGCLGTGTVRETSTSVAEPTIV